MRRRGTELEPIVLQTRRDVPLKPPRELGSKYLALVADHHLSGQWIPLGGDPDLPIDVLLGEREGVVWNSTDIVHACVEPLHDSGEEH